MGMTRKRLFVAAAVFGLLTVVGMIFSWQMMQRSAEGQATTDDLLVPGDHAITVERAGLHDIVLLADMEAKEGSGKPRVEDVRHMRFELEGPEGVTADFTLADGLASIDEEDRVLLLLLGTFSVERAGAWQLRASYPEGPERTPAKIIVGPDAHAVVTASTQWAFSILLFFLVGGSLAIGCAVVGVIVQPKNADLDTPVEEQPYS
jgi:hypothetical protein